MPRFRQESKATIRRRIGYLRHREKFAYGAVLSATSTTFALEQTKPVPDDRYVGAVAHVVSGVGIGQRRLVADSVGGSGLCTISGTWAVTPDVTSIIEIWPEGDSPDNVDAAINQAILDVQDLSVVKSTTTNPTISVDRKTITVPAGWTHIIDVSWVNPDGVWGRARPVLNPSEFDALDQVQHGFAVVNNQIRLNIGVPAAVLGADLALRGYRGPAELTTDSQLCEVRSDFVVYKAATLLEAADVAAPANDPDNSNSRMANWRIEAATIRAQMFPAWEPSTVGLD